ncbi:peptidyl-prolyl cis-trans isomerase D [Geobacter sp. OR-1]|uniref:SurA N-terminal domain-containing protein n=1 Tax=Geobacter sp. OR-1 TaxID=1266765 RepID=UPI000542786C|nr:SurA N-terminal domain-containing protein [Geobacter sp. OR-1]GAM08432.1 peptidyl-prolyl cis-trans isomerase D [Geobacter sp. OR-1]
MLGIMRKYKESVVIKVVFVIIVASFVGTIFLVWGEGGSNSGPKAYAAKVNGGKISLEQYQRSYYQLRGIYEQLSGKSLTPDQEKQLGIKKAALDKLVDSLLISQEARKMGIKVTKDEIVAAVAAVPAFQKDGAFDFKLYQQTLKSNRLTPQEFEDGQEEDLMIKKARQKITDKAQVSDDEALAAYKKRNDKVDLQFVSFSPADVRGEVKLTEQDLTAYLQAHQEQFKTPEQISISYLLVDPAKFTGKVTVTDEEVQTYYQRNIDRFQGKGGILPFAEVKDQAKADAIKAKAAKQAYEATADALNKNLKGADLAAAAKGLGVSISETPLFTAVAPPAQLAGEAELVKRSFMTKQGEFGGPVETKKGIYIVKVKERKPAAVPPLAQIKSQVEARAAIDKAQELAKKKAEEALAAFGKNSVPAKAQDSGPFGFSEKSPLVPKIGASPEVMQAAFDLTTQAPAAKTVFKINDRWYAIKLKNRIAADTASFQQTKEELKKELLPKKQQDAIAAWVKELRAKAKIDINAALITE